jgi:hypothetical protein
LRQVLATRVSPLWYKRSLVPFRYKLGIQVRHR